MHPLRILILLSFFSMTKWDMSDPKWFTDVADKKIHYLREISLRLVDGVRSVLAVLPGPFTSCAHPCRYVKVRFPLHDVQLAVLSCVLNSDPSESMLVLCFYSAFSLSPSVSFSQVVISFSPNVELLPNTSVRPTSTFFPQNSSSKSICNPSPPAEGLTPGWTPSSAPARTRHSQFLF